jgi:hypothetical protein
MASLESKCNRRYATAEKSCNTKNSNTLAYIRLYSLKILAV